MSIGIGEKIKRRLRNQQGLTLVELLFAAAVVSIAMLSSAFMILQGRQMALDARTKLLAVNAARSVLELVKDTPLTSVSGLSTTSYIPSSLPSGAIAITTNPSPIVSSTTIATVTVTVTWKGSRNRTQTLAITTQRSAYS